MRWLWCIFQFTNSRTIFTHVLRRVWLYLLRFKVYFQRTISLKIERAYTRVYIRLSSNGTISRTILTALSPLLGKMAAREKCQRFVTE